MSLDTKIRSESGKSAAAETAWTLLKLSVGLAIVVVLYRKLVQESGAVWPSLDEVRWEAFAACALLMPVNLLLETQVWRVLLSGAGASLSFGRAVPAVLAGFSAGAVSPGGVGDFVGRVVRVPNGRRWITGFVMLLSRLGDIIPLTVCGVAATATLLPLAAGPTKTWMTAVLVTAVPIGLLAVVIYGGHPRQVLPRRLLERLAKRWPDPARAIDLATSIPANVRMTGLVLAVMRYATFVLQLSLAIVALAPSPTHVLALMPAASAVFLLRGIAPPVTMMGLGIREAAAVAVLGLVGVAGQVALVASLSVFALNIVVPALIGIPFLLFPGWRPRALKS